MDTIRLSGTVHDVAQCLALNQRLHAATCVLDWTDVRTVADDAARTLLAGLNASDHADALGVETMADEIADRVNQATGFTDVT